MKVGPTTPRVEEEEEVQETEPQSSLFASYHSKRQKKDSASTPHMQLTHFLEICSGQDCLHFWTLNKHTLPSLFMVVVDCCMFLHPVPRLNVCLAMAGWSWDPIGHNSVQKFWQIRFFASVMDICNGSQLSVVLMNMFWCSPLFLSTHSNSVRSLIRFKPSCIGSQWQHIELKRFQASPI